MQHVRAREGGRGRTLVDEILEIADDAKSATSSDQVQAARLRVDSRKWAASKMKPHTYGDKLQRTGEGGGPIRVRPDLSKLTDEELDALDRILGRVADA